MFNLGKINEALPKALLLEKNLEKMQYNDKLIQVYQLLAYMYAYNNNMDSLIYYNKKYNALFAQIENQNLNKTAQELETIYQTEKKEKEILVQKAKIAEQKAYIIISISVVLFIILLSIFIYNYLNQKNKQLKQENELKDALQKIETQNRLQEQRLQISRDLHDNIGAQLTFIISSIDNLKYAMTDKNPKIEEKLTNISSFTKDTIIELRDTIWAMNKEEITIEDLKSRISNFIENAKLSLNGIDFNFKFNENNFKVKPFTSKNGINIYRIIQEAVNNAIKHAKATKILVETDVTENEIQIAIKDNGVGIAQNKENTGNGLLTMRKRAQELNANFDIKNLEKGTSVNLIIKI
ncbi:MAG: sensor histidine kinase [Chitinophagales bacterium]